MAMANVVGAAIPGAGVLDGGHSFGTLEFLLAGDSKLGRYAMHTGFRGLFARLVVGAPREVLFGMAVERCPAVTEAIRPLRVGRRAVSWVVRAPRPRCVVVEIGGDRLFVPLLTAARALSVPSMLGLPI